MDRQNYAFHRWKPENWYYSNCLANKILKISTKDYTQALLSDTANGGVVVAVGALDSNKRVEQKNPLKMSFYRKIP